MKNMIYNIDSVLRDKNLYNIIDGLKLIIHSDVHLYKFIKKLLS